MLTQWLFLCLLTVVCSEILIYGWSKKPKPTEGSDNGYLNEWLRNDNDDDSPEPSWELLFKSQVLTINRLFCIVISWWKQLHVYLSHKTASLYKGNTWGFNTLWRTLMELSVKWAVGGMILVFFIIICFDVPLFPLTCKPLLQMWWGKFKTYEKLYDFKWATYMHESSLSFCPPSTTRDVPDSEEKELGNGNADWTSAETTEIVILKM